jgi:hypothetical protein
VVKGVHYFDPALFGLIGLLSMSCGALLTVFFLQKVLRRFEKTNKEFSEKHLQFVGKAGTDLTETAIKIAAGAQLWSSKFIPDEWLEKNLYGTAPQGTLAVLWLELSDHRRLLLDVAHFLTAIDSLYSGLFQSEDTVIRRDGLPQRLSSPVLVSIHLSSPGWIEILGHLNPLKTIAGLIEHLYVAKTRRLRLDNEKRQSEREWVLKTVKAFPAELRTTETVKDLLEASYGQLSNFSELGIMGHANIRTLKPDITGAVLEKLSLDVVSPSAELPDEAS